MITRIRVLRPGPNNLAAIAIAYGIALVCKLKHVARVGPIVILFSLLADTSASSQCPVAPPWDSTFLAENDLGPLGLSKSSVTRPPIAAATKYDDQSNWQMRVWGNQDPKSLWGDVRDIRLFFVSADLAARYFETHQEFLSEGAPLESEMTLDEVPIRIFGPRNAKAAALARSLGIPEEKFTGYAFIFQFKNLVAKLFILRGMESEERVSSRSYIPLAKAVLKKLREACR
ncbi:MULTISPECIES: hypothetical protein [unclassified Bradyrhizobium]|uniref:hypothetical protein n=1 Tax=unclassified Bradyrhizobium TaxID=2631580 RepID=UPI0028ED3EB2|nr:MULTISPECIES: hypothetical protein [unclassified Bradyrhizobium]